MTRHILLDSSPLGLLSNPMQTAEVVATTQWGLSRLASGHRLYMPEVIDYELRRELLRAGKASSLTALDHLRNLFYYLPLTTAVMRRAAELWATARSQGFATGDPKKLDINVILCAQALTLPEPAVSVTVATANVGHISHFVSADLWTNIRP